MIKIGIVNIDTSHPSGFGDIILENDRACVYGVYNDGFRTEEEVNDYLKKYKVNFRAKSIKELAQKVDVGFVQSCNWDNHIAQAMPFIEAGKPVFFDKPIVGNYKDCLKVEQLVKEGAKIFGSSSLRYCYEVQDYFKIPEDDRGEILSIFSSLGVDEFNYGVHLMELVGGFKPSGAESVRYLGENKGSNQYYVKYSDGLKVIYQTYAGAWMPFTCQINTTKKVYQVKIDNTRIYRALLERIFDYLENGAAMASIGELTETIKIYLAGKKSKENAGVETKLSSLNQNDTGFDGSVFEKQYALANKRK